MQSGYIMSGNTPVASFSGRVVTPILPALAPLCFRNGGDLNTWLEMRAADNYWVRFDGEPATRWEDARLFQDNLAELALRGRPTASTQPLRCNTPELTNTGNYEKCWKLENSRWVMHKRGTPGEIFSEAFAAELGKLLGFPMAEYWAAENCVVTRDFTAGQFNLEPMAYLTGEDEDYGTNYNTLKRLRPGLEHVVRFVIVNYQKFQQKQV